MKKSIFLISFFFVAAIVKAQQPILFKIKYLPNRLYNTDITTTMDMTMDISGDQQKMDELKANGVKLPMTMAAESDSKIDIKTGSMGTKNSFPIKFKFSDISSKQMVNGQGAPGSANPLAGQAIYAHCNSDGDIGVDSIPGKAIDDQIKASMKAVIGNLSKAVQFPEKPIRIGDTFSQDVPIGMPIAGMNMKFVVKIIYKLTSVENNQASFDLDESMSLDMSGKTDTVGMTATGGGKGRGKLVYSIEQNFPVVMTTNMDFSLKMVLEGMTMTCAAKMTSDNKTQVAAGSK